MTRHCKERSDEAIPHIILTASPRLHYNNVIMRQKLTLVSVSAKIAYMANQFGAKILSFGRAVPETVVTNKDLEKLFETTEDWIIQRTGIRERRVVDPAKGENAVSLGSLAAERALAKAGIKAEDLDLIICATATGDYLFPATSCLIQKKIGASNAAAFDMAAACTGYIYALNVAYNFIRCGQYRNVMVLAVDLMSRFIDWSDRRTAILFGDGAGATLLSACAASEDAFKAFNLKADGDDACTLFVPNTGSHYPVAAADITAKPTMVYMDGQAVYQFAVRAVPDSLKTVCELAGVQPEELDYVVPHQANTRIIEGAAKRLKIPIERFITNIERYGNTSAASIPIAFDEALELGTIKRDADKKLKIAMVGFGAGLTWGSAIIDY